MKLSDLHATKIAAAAVCALVLGAAACSSGGDKPETGGDTGAGGQEATEGPTGEVEIVYIQKQDDQQYFVDQAQGAKDAAAELGIRLTVAGVGDDANKAVSEVQSAIARNVAGIIIVAPDQAIGPQVIAMANDAGIPIMASDDILVDEAGAEAPFAGFDGTGMGMSVGEKAAELYQAAGWSPDNTKILSVYKMDLSVCVQRVEGAQAKFAEIVGADNVPDIIDVGTDASVTDSLDKTTATVTANPGVTNWVVWGCNDESETGAVTALQNSGVAPGNIIGVGLGAYLTCKDWEADIESGNKAALYISGWDVGQAAVRAMAAKVLDGVDLPAQSIADTHMVDPSSYVEAGVQCT